MSNVDHIFHLVLPFYKMKSHFSRLERGIYHSQSTKTITVMIPTVKIEGEAIQPMWQINRLLDWKKPLQNAVVEIVPFVV